MKILFGRNDWWYRVGFAIINWLEATAELIVLGQISMGWVLSYACWYAKRCFRKIGK